MNKQPNYPHTLPEIPPGMDYARDSFWYRLRHKFRWKRESEAWAWYIQQRDKAALHGEKFPPAPIFAQKTTMPQPWDGRDEKPAKPLDEIGGIIRSSICTACQKRYDKIFK